MREVKKYIQYSKKLATAALVLYFVVCAICQLLVSQLKQNSYEQEAVVSFHGATATLCGVIITAYMGNSSIEKYGNQKFKYQKLTTTENETEVENG